jgi:hypothetical protein
MIMLAANLICCVLFFVYFAWLTTSGWRLARRALFANTAQDVLKNVLSKKRFYFVQSVMSFIILAFFAGVKAVLILMGKFNEGVFASLIFGNIADQNLFDKIGWVGVLLIIACVFCWYQHFKANHQFQVLYAFRKQLGLTELGC